MKPILVTTSSFDTSENPALRRLRAAGHEIVTNPFGRRLSEGEVTALLGEHDPEGMIAGVEPLTDSAFECAPSLRHVARCGTGMDSVDLTGAARRGISVSNTPAGPSAAVSELALGVMLTVLRRIAEADRAMRAGDWQQLRGGLLQARRVGIVGFGRIGRRVADLIAAFGAEIQVYDPMLPADCRYPAASTLDDLLERSDILTLHVPYSDELNHIVDARALSRLPQGAIVLNLSRGGLVDEQALMEALESGHLAGAGIDCFEEEPYSGRLTQFANVVLTAHMGSYALEARRLMEVEAAENLERALAPVNKES